MPDADSNGYAVEDATNRFSPIPQPESDHSACAFGRVIGLWISFPGEIRCGRGTHPMLLEKYRLVAMPPAKWARLSLSDEKCNGCGRCVEPVRYSC